MVPYFNLQFVNGNYAGHSPHIDIVEGPVSVGREFLFISPRFCIYKHFIQTDRVYRPL